MNAAERRLLEQMARNQMQIMIGVAYLLRNGQTDTSYLFQQGTKLMGSVEDTRLALHDCHKESQQKPAPPPLADPLPLPSNVYWNTELRDFYSMDKGKPLGGEFKAHWLFRVTEFPMGKFTADGLKLDDREDESR